MAGPRAAPKIWIYGASPREVIGQLLAGTWGMAYGAGQVLYKATPLLLAGVMVLLWPRAGLLQRRREGEIASPGA